MKERGTESCKERERSPGGVCMCVCVMVNQCQDRMEKKRRGKAEGGKVLLVSEN